jgi:glyoxylase-like metal-dependent hydrolase (beta-lactamase superfamily II)
MSAAEAICLTCGTQYETDGAPPVACPICQDDRQYVNPEGQRWTSLAELRAGGAHQNLVAEVEPGLIGVRTEPAFAIAQRAYLIQTEAGNLLWDCVSYLDDATVAAVERHGGIAAIAISHPHFYSSMVEWSRAFGGVPIYLHADNQPWVMRPDPAIRYWSEESIEPLPGLTLIRCGGHFPGSSVLHWPAGATGRGALLTGDTIYVVADPRWVTFMYSYPNAIPLDAATVRRIVAAVEPYPFDRLYSSWPGRVVEQDAKGAVHRSAERYIAKIGG